MDDEVIREGAGRVKTFAGRLGATRVGSLVLVLIAVGLMCPTLALASAGSGASNGPPGEYCHGCQPPLSYLGGPVASTLGPGGLTVTPVYWVPQGSKDRFPAGYRGVIDQFITNVAAASGADSNVLSINSEYYDIMGGQPRNIRYRITAGSPIVMTAPLPANRCGGVDEGYDACVTDDQLVAQLNAALAARHLPRGLAQFYPVFFPPGVETWEDPDDTSASTFCAYHGSTGRGADQILYANEPYPTDGCRSGQSPNGNVDADAALSPLSHELNETITDPETAGRAGWRDHAGYEIGDLCSWTFGTPLGSTDPSAAQSTEYNQVINGGHYWLQVEFSNHAYRQNGVGAGCQPSESAALRGSESAANSPTHIYFETDHNTLPANGKATTTGIVQVYNDKHEDTPGDRIFFTTYALYGHGNCGTLKPRSAVTDGAGTVFPVYRASRRNIACVVVANDAEGGRSASIVVYQGSTRKRAPRLRGTFPRKIIAGRTTTFTTRITNPTRTRIADTQVNFGIFVPFYDSPNVPARQVRLWVSWTGSRGRFVPVHLTGSTSNDAGIIGVIGGATGFSLPARRTITLSYRMQVSRRAPRDRARPILEFQTFLDQINPGSGADSVLTTTPGTNATVLPLRRAHLRRPRFTG